MAIDDNVQYQIAGEGAVPDNDKRRQNRAEAFLGAKADDIIQQLKDGRLKTDDAFSDRPSMELASNERNDNYL